MSGNLVPIKILLEFVIKGTLEAMNKFADMMSKTNIQHPKEIAPDYHVFIIGTHINMLTKLFSQI